MYTAITLVISLLLTFVIVWLFARLKIFDFIGELGCGGFALFRLLEVVVIFVASFCIVTVIVDKRVSKYDFTNTYLTTKTPFSIYEKIEKEPYGKEIGTIKADTVIKLQAAKKKGSVTWLDGYILENGSPKHIFMLIPDTNFEIKQNGKYFDFNEKSKSFGEYYKRIDDENALTLENIQDEFLQELSDNNITVEHSSDNVLRESIKKSHYFLSEKGYFGLFKAESTEEFYYIENESKKLFKKLVNSYYNKLEKETKPYFAKED